MKKKFLGRARRITVSAAAALGLIGAVTVPATEVAPGGSAIRKGMITNVEPRCWWTGMANDTLQLLITGPGIGNADFAVDYPGVELLRQFSLDSPNYKFLYLS